MTTQLKLEVGVKTDPIEYRYSYEWLFRILAEEGVRNVQIGTFFEIYQLPDDCFVRLRARAEDFGLTITSVFTAHRELGGFFRDDPAWEAVAYRNFARLIEVGALLGARSVGSNPGAVMRDRLGLKPRATACYVENMKRLMRHAHEVGVATLGIEPMSCLAEPPTTPDEMREIVEELWDFHRANPETATVGLCADVSHGLADRNRNIVFDNLQLLEAALPYTHEIHLKNTDPIFNSTFGFTAEERARGIVDVARVRDLIVRHAGRLPVDSLIGYLEIGGPKLGRDYSDHLLEEQLRESLRHVKECFTYTGEAAPAVFEASGTVAAAPAARTPTVIIAPSLMCADMGHLAEEIRRLEEGGCEWLHFDVMDAHFVPNMPLGLVTIQHVRALTDLPFDVHLMVERNDFFIERLGPIGVQWISVHAESSIHLDRTLQLIRAQGARAGVALNPATPLSALDYVLEHLDYVLIMTVNPGYAGQKLVASAWRKIADTRDYLAERGVEIPIEVDGNVSFENIPRMVAAGADALVAGTSSVYHMDGSRSANIRRVRECIAEGLSLRAGHTKGANV